MEGFAGGFWVQVRQTAWALPPLVARMAVTTTEPPVARPGG